MNLQEWSDQLGSGGGLSHAFRRRHARVLAALEVGAAQNRVDAARRVAARDPRGAGRLLAGQRRRRVRAGQRAHRVEGSPLPAAVRRAADDGEDVLTVVDGFPPLQSCAVPIHPDRRAVVVPDPDGDLVAMRWSVSSLPVRRANRTRLTALADRLTLAGIVVSAPDVATVLHVDGSDPWVFAPHHGTTVEDLLRDGPLDPGVRYGLVVALTALRHGFLDDGWVWQGFAPRNMFLTGSGLVLIDFEECVDLADDPVRSAACLLWHELFFAGSLTADERRRVFAEHSKTPRVDADRVMEADPFEAEVLGRSRLSWAERVDLLARSTRIESSHRRAGGGRLDGHALGHFWGDFLPDAAEARIFGCLDGIKGAGDLAAVLEVFEAAMEADIDAMLRADVHGEPLPSPARTPRSRRPSARAPQAVSARSGGPRPAGRTPSGRTRRD